MVLALENLTQRGLACRTRGLLGSRMMSTDSRSQQEGSVRWLAIDIKVDVTWTAASHKDVQKHFGVLAQVVFRNLMMPGI